MALVKLRVAVLLLLPFAVQASDYLFFTGSYTKTASKGIYAWRLQTATGRVRSLGLAADMSNPSFLALHPNGRFVYAASRDLNVVAAFSIDEKSGKLALLNYLASGGAGPCHLAVDATGRWLAVANYDDGALAILPIKPDGRVGEARNVQRHEGHGPHPERQKGPHAHQAVFSPDNRYLLLGDLGLDRIFVYRFDAASGTLSANDPAYVELAAGAGARHIAFHPNGRAVYAIAELASTVTAFQYDKARGSLKMLQTISTLPSSFCGTNAAAEIAVNRAGTVLYASNRGHDSIALFSIDPERFTLTAIDDSPTLGKTPRHFAFDPSGGFLLAANQESNELAIFRVHANTGQLTPVARSVVNAFEPACILFLQSAASAGAARN